MDRQGRMEKENKIKTLGTEICENIDTLYINYYYYYYYYYYHYGTYVQAYDEFVAHSFTTAKY